VVYVVISLRDLFLGGDVNEIPFVVILGWGYGRVHVSIREADAGLDDLGRTGGLGGAYVLCTANNSYLAEVAKRHVQRLFSHHGPAVAKDPKYFADILITDLRRFGYGDQITLPDDAEILGKVCIGSDWSIQYL
jgi:hypothetical protein